jgi:hypothetical protein
MEALANNLMKFLALSALVLLGIFSNTSQAQSVPE